MVKRKYFNAQAAVKAGYSQEEVQSFLSKHPELITKRLPWILRSRAIPFAMGGIGAGLGALSGLALGGLPAAATGPVLGAASYGAGDTIRRGLTDLLTEPGLGLAQNDKVATIGNPPSNQEERGDMAYEQVSGMMTSAMMAPILKMALPYLLAGIPGMDKLAGKLLERTARTSPNVPNSALEKEFGSVRMPNPQLTAGLSPARDRSALDQMVNHEIMTQGRSEMNGGGVPALDVQKLRAGSYANSGKWSPFNQITPEQALNKRMGISYSNILHEYSPKTQLYDNIINKSKLMQKLYAGLTILGLANAAINKFSNGTQESITNFISDE